MEEEKKSRHLKKFLNHKLKTLIENKKEMQSVESEGEEESSLSDQVINESSKAFNSNDDRTKAQSSDQDIKITKINKRKVYIYNIEWNIHENLLEKFLCKYGKVKRSKIIRDFNTNKSKGFGYIEFFDEKDASKLLNENKPEELILKERQLNVRPFESRSKNKTRIRNISSMQVDEPKNEGNITDSKSPLNDLPIDILANIFSKLCLRDLCIVEQVCKKWRSIAHLVWQSKKSLILDNKNIFENYESKSQTTFGFKLLPKFDGIGLRQILNKKFGQNLRVLDLSGSSKWLSGGILPMIADECSNLINLNISKLNVSNYSFKTLRRCSKLKDLNLSYCSQISDISIIRLLYSCKELETIDMTYCHLITGKCFSKNADNLRNITLDQCENLDDQYLIEFFAYNKNLLNLSLKRIKQYKAETLLCIIKNLTKLKSLNISEYGFNSLSNYQIENLNFNQSQIVSLNLSGCVAESKLISNILKTSTSLKNFNLSYCSKVTDESFVNSPISCPLEELNLNFLRQLTDATLESLCQKVQTLKSLYVKGCYNLTNEGINKVLVRLPNLVNLDVQNNVYVNNSLLESALDLETRSIFILCNDTSVDTIKFEFKYPEVKRKLIDRNCYEFSYKNLRFQSFLTNQFQAKEDAKVWQQDGFYYIGSSLDSDEDDFDLNINDDCNDHDDNEDDMDFLNDEEHEMYNELDY